MFAIVKQRKILSLTLALFSFVTICVQTPKIFLQVPPTKEKPYPMEWIQNSSISCYYDTEKDVLPSAEDASFSLPADTIFFHETSCHGGLNSRQACAVEAAARAHPGREIYVLFSGPVSYKLLSQSCLATLVHLANVHFARVHIDEYTKGTALEELVALGTYYRSKWPVEHTSDILRFVSLYKWGGIYLDMDLIVLKPLDDLGKNWAARQDDYFVNVAAVAIGEDETGRQLIGKLLKDVLDWPYKICTTRNVRPVSREQGLFFCIEELKTNFKPDIWINNGPGTMSRVLKVFCNTSDIVKLSAKKCRGFEVFSQGVIYPISYMALVEKYQKEDLYDFDDASTVHLWNHVTHHKSYKEGSLMDNLLSEFCPMIYYNYKETLLLAQSQTDMIPK